MRKRSSYKPRGVNPEAWKVGMRGALKLSTADQIRTLQAVRDGVEDLVKCKPSRAAWSAVFDCINLIEAFAANGVIKTGGRDLVEVLQQHVLAAMERQRATGSNVLRPCEAASLWEMLQAYGQVLAICTHRELFEAMGRVERKVRQALCKGSHGSVTVLEAA